MAFQILHDNISKQQKPWDAAETNMMIETIVIR